MGASTARGSRSAVGLPLSTRVEPAIIDRIVALLPLALTILIGASMAVLWARVGRSNWQLVGDEAVVVLRSTDVIGPNSPLLGMPSAVASWTTDADPFHPGPSVFWVLTPFTAVLGPTVHAALAGTWTLAIVAVAVVLRTTARLLGPAASVAAAGFVVVILIVTPDVWRPLNPVMVALPALALCFVTWSVVCGRGLSWPLAAALASLVLQADLAYLPLTVVLVAFAVVVTGARWVRSRSEGSPPPLTRRQLISTAAVVAVMWALPLVESVGLRGNYYEMLKAASSGVSTVGLGDAVGASWHVVGAAVLIAVVLAYGRRSLSSSARWLGATALALAFSAVVTSAATPAATGLTDPNYQLPVRVAAVFVIFSAMVLVLALVPWRFVSRPMVGVIVGILLLCTVGRTLGWAFTKPVNNGWLSGVFDSIPSLSDQLNDELSHGPYELRPLGGPESVGLTLGLARAMEADGIAVHTERGLARYTGARRLRDGGEDGVLYLTFHDEAPRRTAELVGQWRRPEGGGADSASGGFDPSSMTLAGPPYGIGSVVAGTGRDLDAVVGLDEVGLMETAAALLDEPELRQKLSDRALVDLARRGFLSGADPVQTSTDPLLSAVDVVSIWLDRSAS